ncbi:hypothetical protein [Tateyamaria sp. ANG-S1]|uniref:hypothetical protein n=1 Tax=Tateyamaria sp. ANG-S1 TaxID=1577905 RepID=UPI00057C67E7|nr:hypothetical protein [Tateyamaria sp. ANG-S1]KIC47940.1 hypothetical protein RA29_17125 [Tateyamaria sp. ANG-S1]
MLTIGLLYFNLGLGAVAALTVMILRIGALAQDCPHSKPRAGAAATAIATGFAAIGAGGVIMIGAVLPLLEQEPFAALMLALGFAALCLGLGFTHAMGSLRAALVPDPAA